MMLPSIAAHPYDDVANQYDRIWSSPQALEEDRQIMERIAYTEGDVIDIGCGTGLFLDHYPNCNSYLGIDPSEAMLNQLLTKHPDKKVSCQTFEDFLGTAPPKQYDLMISLFGSPSYIDPTALNSVHDLLKPKGKLLMMFIAPDYTPVTHQYIENPPELINHNFASYGEVFKFGNYVVTQK